MTEVWAIPGQHSIIDEIDPSTGLTRCLGRDAANVLKDYPDAKRMTWDAWKADAIARQQTPIRWRRTDARTYDKMLNILPPAAWIGGAFLVGEPIDHAVETGLPRFEAFWLRGTCTYPAYYVSSRPITVVELKRELYGRMP